MLQEYKAAAVNVHTAAFERNAFRLEAQSLFQAFIGGEQDFAAGADDAVPGQTMRCLQRPHHLTSGAREAGLFGDFAVGGDMAF
jgi:hypothetical protein